MTLAPPFSYFGGKTRLAPWIVAHLPAHRHYVEPFAGSLAVLLAKPRAKLETVNDLDGDLMTFWRVLRDRPEELVRACALTPHARAEFEGCWASVELGIADDLERARAVWVLLSQGRGARAWRSGWRHFADPGGTSVGMPGYLHAYLGRMVDAAERLAGVSLEARHALDVIERYGRHDGVLIYADPPYLDSERRAATYRVEMGSEDEHRALAVALHAARAAVILSGYDSPLYDDLYDDWHRVETATWTGNAAKGTGDRVEVLWSNVPLGATTLFGAAPTGEEGSGE